MATGSAIEWTEATWNPSTGCSKVSSGCKNCYAERLTVRLRAMGLAKYSRGFHFTEHESEVRRPLSWKKPRRIFVNSMSDLFHEEATWPFVARCFGMMMEADWHTYQVLTKRPRRMAAFSRRFERERGHAVPPHIWMGTSVENAATANRIDRLREVRCVVRFVSFEPLLGPIAGVDLADIDWAIIGGESGHRHRPVKKEWVESLIRECKRQRVRVFFKQWGGFTPKVGGRKIRGRTHDEYPIMRIRGAPRARRAAAAGPRAAPSMAQRASNVAAAGEGGSA